MVSIKEHLELIFGETGDSSIECNDDNVPIWFDETKFKRGQKYFQVNSMGILMSKLCGILCLMGVPEILNWTNRNMNVRKLTTRQIFKRNQRIVASISEYYLDSFSPKAKSWKDMLQFRKILEISTKNGRKSELTGINHRFLVLVQFSCIGFVLVRPDKFGISTDNTEDIEGFVHLWRVVGWLYGLNDHVNICRTSLSETKDLCETLLRNIFIYSVNSKEETYRKLTNTFFQSIYYSFPFLTEDATRFYIQDVIQPSSERTIHDMALDRTMEDYSKNVKLTCHCNESVRPLGLYGQVCYNFIVIVRSVCIRSTFLKWFCNWIVCFLLNVLFNWPVLVYVGFYLVEFLNYFVSKIKIILKVN